MTPLRFGRFSAYNPAVSDSSSDYLAPYQRAARKHGAGFGSLLWASPGTQGARFEAITRLYNFDGSRVLDAGCGRADLLDFWDECGVHPCEYTGMEAVSELRGAARRKVQPGARIVDGDFVRDPARLLVGAEVIVFSGSLNTLPRNAFYRTLGLAYGAASEAIVFNFLAGRLLASASWLTWHAAEDVLAFAGRVSRRVESLADYLDGDCTVAMWK